MENKGTFALPIDDDVARFVSASLKLEGFFPEFKADHLAHLFPNARLMFYPAGTHVIEQGDEGRDLFIILQGRVSISQTLGDAGAEVAQLGDGDIFGEIALILNGVRTATAITAADSKIFQLAFKDMDYILKNNPDLAKHLQSLAVKRV